tara:strand:+ start:8315 stop:8701 length:387 start_codon:yes stop_codon:yes gene_type:complete
LKNYIQALRYSSIGLFHNLLGYFLYILITYLGLKPEYAVTILYPLGATINYYGNAKFTFKYFGDPLLAKIRFILAHFSGYLINLFILYIFVRQFLFPHELIQFISTGIIAIYLFFASKFFIFRNITRG